MGDISRYQQMTRDQLIRQCMAKDDYITRIESAAERQRATAEQLERMRVRALHYSIQNKALLRMLWKDNLGDVEQLVIEPVGTE